MSKYYEVLSQKDINAIHDTSMSLLSNIGIRFPDETTLSIFKKSGFRTESDKVFFHEEQVMRVIKTVPREFRIQARNPEKDVIIGNGKPVFAPGYGTPFLYDLETGKRPPTLKDFHIATKLAHQLPNQDLCGHLMVQPSDIDSNLAHLHMLKACILNSDKPFIGSTNGARGANDTVEIVKILFGENANHPGTLGLINTFSPLGFSNDTLKALVTYAQARQPVMISAFTMAGTTGPITLAGMIAQQNAEILAGIVLAQTIKPGLPLLYGSASTNTDMRTGSPTTGSPETSLCISAHAQMARFYNLPSRGGGALTDSASIDTQAGFEAMLSLQTTINSGIDFVLHSAGILEGYKTFSFEKFVLDDEMCGMMRRYNKGIEVKPETMAYDVISKVSHNGNFLSEKHTLQRCRTEFWEPRVIQLSKKSNKGTNKKTDITHQAHTYWKNLITQHETSPMDKIIKKQLDTYIEKGLLDLAQTSNYQND